MVTYFKFLNSRPKKLKHFRVEPTGVCRQGCWDPQPHKGEPVLILGPCIQETVYLI